MIFVVTALIGDVTVSVVGDVFLVEFACGTTMDTMDDAFACGTCHRLWHDDDATTMMTLQPAYDEDFLFLILMRSLCNGMDGRLLLHYGMGGNNVAVVLYVVG